jgi:hypothetical protein
MTAPEDPDTESDLGPEKRAPNTGALVAFIISLTLGVGGLFVLPALQSMFGLDFRPAFAIVLAIEIVALVGVIVSVLRLYRGPTIE